MAGPVRGTQTLVDQMGWVLRRPALVALEIAWRWTFGLPFLVLCLAEARHILAVLPLETTGWANLDTQNPWVAAVQFADVWARYQPRVTAAALWLLPVSALAWVIISGLGRGVVFTRLEPGLGLRPIAVMAFQALWLAMLGLILFAWIRSLSWVAATHIDPAGEADLVGYSIWAIFLTLGFFTVWALVSWPFAIAPMLMLLERRSAFSALIESFRLERTFTGKLMEINLVMGIVKLALMVVAMVFSAAPLPFSDALGPDAMHVVWFGATVFYLVANDYFHLVRLKGFVEFWRSFRGEGAGSAPA